MDYWAMILEWLAQFDAIFKGIGYLTTIATMAIGVFRVPYRFFSRPLYASYRVTNVPGYTTFLIFFRVAFLGGLGSSEVFARLVDTSGAEVGKKALLVDLTKRYETTILSANDVYSRFSVPAATATSPYTLLLYVKPGTIKVVGQLFDPSGKMSNLEPL